MTSRSNNEVKSRFFIISDTHAGFQGDSADPYSKDEGAFRPIFPKSDVLLHSGDLTMIGTMSQYRNTLTMLKNIDAELKLVIAGNHDLSLHGSYYQRGGNAKELQNSFATEDEKYDPDLATQAQELWTGPEAKDAGVTYLTEGLHVFTLSNGAQFTIYASPWQPEFYNWAFNYPHNEDRWNPPHLISKDFIKDTIPAPADRDPHPIPEDAQVDIVMTHGPPWKHLDKCMNGTEAGCPHLLKALDRVRPRLHCFGHIHEAWGAEIVKWKKTDGEISGNGKAGESTEVTFGLTVGDESSGIQAPNDVDVVGRRAAFVDVSAQSKRPLRVGNETLLVNSCIMDYKYNANGAGWLVDLDLPRKQD